MGRLDAQEVNDLRKFASAASLASKEILRELAKLNPEGPRRTLEECLRSVQLCRRYLLT